jgi:hypothetical protein
VSQPGGTDPISAASDADGTRVEQNDGATILGLPDFTGTPNEHISPQQHAGEIAYYLQQAQADCRSDRDRVEDDRAGAVWPHRGHTRRHHPGALRLSGWGPRARHS